MLSTRVINRGIASDVSQHVDNDDRALDGGAVTCINPPQLITLSAVSDLILIAMTLKMKLAFKLDVCQLFEQQATRL